jgi:uncharacterized protein (TIGR02996 family)
MTHEAFLRAILDEPDDDVHRLVYADWLEEGDDPRGPFIRAQVEAASLPAGDPRRAELEGRANELLRLHQDEWDRPLIEAAGYDPNSGGLLGVVGLFARALTGNGGPLGVVDMFTRLFRSSWPRPPLYLRSYHRGFVDVIHFAMANFVDRAEALFAVAPIQEVYFEVVSSPLTELAALPQLARVRGLHLLYTYLYDDSLIDLFRSPHLTGLRTLDLAGNHLSERGLRVLGAAPCASRLLALHLSGCDLTASAALALAESPALIELTTLDLSNNTIGDQGLTHLAGAAHLRHLTSLNVSGSEVGAEGALALARSPHLTKLQELNLGGAVIGREAMALLRERFAKASITF